MAQLVKNLPANAGDLDSIPALGRPPGEGNSYSLQYSCPGNPMDRGAWWATAHGVTKSWTRLSDWACTHACIFNMQMCIWSIQQGHTLIQRLSELAVSRGLHPHPARMRSASQRQEPCPASLCALICVKYICICSFMSIYEQNTLLETFDNQCVTERQAPWQGGGGWPEMPCLPAPFRPVGDAAWTVWLRLRSEPNKQGVAGRAGGWTEMGELLCPGGWACASLPLNHAPNPHQRHSSGFLPKVQTHRGGRRGTARAATPSREPGGDECLELPARLGKAAARPAVGALRVTDITELPRGLWKLWTQWGWKKWAGSMSLVEVGSLGKTRSSGWAKQEASA